MRNSLHSIEKMQKRKVNHAMVASIFLMVVLTLSVATINMGSATATTNGQKFLLALFLQYVGRDAQVNIYQPNMDSNDFTRLRVQNGDQLKSDYVTAAKNLPGPAAVAFMSSQEIVENAARVKSLGFDAIEFNLESGLSPSSDNSNVVAAMRRAADAAHAQGLEFRATPSRSYTTQYGSQIAPFVDYYHIQAQALQDNGINAYSDYVHAQVAKLRQANPDLLISVQISTQQSNAPGLSLLQTLQQCVDSVMDVADGVSVWFGNDDLNTLRSFVEWYDDKWSSSSTTPPPTPTPGTVTIAFANLQEGQRLDNDYQVVVTSSSPSDTQNIKLYVDTTLIKTETSAPYEFTVDPDDFSNGNHVIKAVALLDDGTTVTKSLTANLQ
jgi:hypothetical protein